MGSVLSHAANGIGGFLGNVFTAPFKTIFNGSCEDVCSSPWDLICFIEHLCVSNLVRLLMILGLCYLLLLFFYLLFKIGICQCIVKSLCKMCCAACETYWYAIEDMTCHLWHKLKNTKRINRRRRRFRDLERGDSSSSLRDFSDSYVLGRKRKSLVWEGRRNYGRNDHQHHHHHYRLKSREVSVHVKGGSKRLRNSRKLQLIRAGHRHHYRHPDSFKRRRVR